MICERIMLYDGRHDVYFDTYIPNESAEYCEDTRRPAIVICPGGAYQYTSDREAEFVALAFASKGFSAFILRYSVAKNAAMPTPLIEAAKTLAAIRDNAETWHIDKDKIAICGFSAGGHLASTLATKWQEPFLKEALGRDNADFRPNAQVLAYPCIVWPNKRCQPYSTGIEAGDLKTLKEYYPAPFTEGRVIDLEKIFSVKDGIYYCDDAELMHQTLTGKTEYTQEDLNEYCSNLHVSDKTPPAFIWTTAGDSVVAATDSLAYADALARQGINTELHMFGKGDHGYAMAEPQTARDASQIDPVAASWFPLAVKWLEFIWE